MTRNSFRGKKILFDNACKETQFAVKGGKIFEDLHEGEVSKDFGDLLVVPGFIDIQVNGAFGVDLTGEPEKIAYLAKMLPATGVTSFLATFVSQDLSEYASLLHRLAASLKQEGAEVLGVHLEGPHFSKKRSGAHEGAVIREKCDLDFWRDLFSLPQAKLIKMVTLAPEVENGQDFVRLLKKNQIIASCGHTDASYEEMKYAIENGLGSVTHLFNAMRELHHRNPGAIGAVLGDKALPFSLIVDGVHVHEAVVRMSWNAHSEGLILTTDASAPLGMPKGVYSIGNNEIEIREKAAYKKGTNTLAGSICPMNRMCSLLKAVTSCSLIEAIQTATLRPAKLLGIDMQKGILKDGFDADFCVLDPTTFEVLETYVAGRLVFSLNSHVSC